MKASGTEPVYILGIQKTFAFLSGLSVLKFCNVNPCHSPLESLSFSPFPSSIQAILCQEAFSVRAVFLRSKAISFPKIGLSREQWGEKAGKGFTNNQFPCLEHLLSVNSGRLLLPVLPQNRALTSTSV